MCMQRAKQIVSYNRHVQKRLCVFQQEWEFSVDAGSYSTAHIFSYTKKLNIENDSIILKFVGQN